MRVEVSNQKVAAPPSGWTSCEYCRVRQAKASHCISCGAALVFELEAQRIVPAVDEIFRGTGGYCAFVGMPIGTAMFWPWPVLEDAADGE